MQFRILAIFLVCVFLMGGSARAEVQSLVILRPMAIIVASYGIFTINTTQWRQYRGALLLLLATITLTSLHLIPLPPSIWTKLAGRELLDQIGHFIGAQSDWRPLSVVPRMTWNALFSLSVPAAVILLMVQLNSKELRQSVVIVISLIFISAILSLMQIIGVKFSFYALPDDTSGLLTNRNHQAVLLCLLLPMLAAYSAGIRDDSRRKLSYALSVCGVALALPVILLSGSRAGLILLFICALFVPLVHVRRSARAAKKFRFLMLSAGVLALVVPLVALFALSARSIAVDRLGASVEDLRFPLWKSVFEAIPAYMPWGSGIGSYVEAYQVFEPDSLLRPGYSNHAHNEYLEVALTAGIPGCLLIVAAFATYIFLTYREIRARDASALRRLGLAILAILAIASLFDYPIRAPLMTAVFAAAIVWASSVGKFSDEYRKA